MADGNVFTILGGHGAPTSGAPGRTGIAGGGEAQVLLAGALITNRDGIVGRWRTPTQPTQLHTENIDNLWRWSRDRRAQIIDFEIGSRLAFSADDEKADPRRMSIFHAEITNTLGDPKPATYHPLVRLSRPADAVFLTQADQVANYADLRGDRVAEILAQMEGGLPFLSSIVYLTPARTPFTLELLDAVFRSVQMVEMRIKHALASRRPVEYSSQIQPLIETPAHSSFPSGHSTESFAYAIVLIRLLSSLPEPRVRMVEMLRQAARIAINRQVAGLHFPVDSAAGALLGLTLGEYLVQRFRQRARSDAWAFLGDKVPADPDFQFQWDTFFDIDGNGGAGKQVPCDYVGSETSFDLGSPSLILGWLWAKAQAEWS